LLLFDSRTVAVAQPHTAEAERRYFKIAKCALLQLILLARLFDEAFHEPKTLPYKGTEFCGRFGLSTYVVDYCCYSF